MKNMILLLLLPAFTCAQIGKTEKVSNSWEIIGIANKVNGYPRLEKTVMEDERDYYLLHYRNLEYRQLDDRKNFYFYAKPDELDYLYNEILNNLDSE